MMKQFSVILIISFLTAFEGQAQQGDFYDISRLPFTSDEFDEFAPAFYRQGIVFTTNRREEFLISRLTDEGERLFNIYYADKRESGKWRKPELLDKSLRSNYHDGPVSFSPDGSKIYFTRNIPGSGREASKLGIFMAEYSDGGWINITPFPYNSSNYNVAHPSICSDGKTLYFSSDMPGGYGGMDIYSSTLQAYSWSPPVNLGKEINSGHDEVFPYIHPGGRLYFSSDNNTPGSLDLFFSIFRNNRWQSPVRLPEPFNSEADDFGFIASRELVNGYFTSNREGSDNIYSFVSTFPVFSQCDSIREPQLCYVFFEKTAEKIDTTTLYLEWDMGDGTRIRGMEAEHCFEDIGTYQVRLDVVDIITKEVQSNVAYYNFTIPRIEQPFITSPDTAYVNQQIRLDASETYLRNFDVDEYYWEPGDGIRATGEEIFHTYTDPGIYEIRLGVLSDPDSPYGQQRRCVYKNIVILASPAGNTEINSQPGPSH